MPSKKKKKNVSASKPVAKNDALSTSDVSAVFKALAENHVKPNPPNVSVALAKTSGHAALAKTSGHAALAKTSGHAALAKTSGHAALAKTPGQAALAKTSGQAALAKTSGQTALAKTSGQPTQVPDVTKGNTITLRVPSYYSKALHSLASKPPPVVQMSKLTDEEIALACRKRKAPAPAREPVVEEEEIPEEVVEKKPLLNKKSKLKALKKQRAIARQRETLPTDPSSNATEDHQLAQSTNVEDYPLEGTDQTNDPYESYAPLEGNYLEAMPEQLPPPPPVEQRIRTARRESGSSGTLEPLRCLKCEKSSTTALEMKLSNMKLEKELEKLRVEVEFYKSKDRENQVVMASLRETQEYFLNRIRALETEVQSQPAMPLLHIPNGVPPPEVVPTPKTSKKRKSAVVAAAALEAEEEVTPIAASRPKRQSAPLKVLTNGNAEEEETPTRPNKRAKIKAPPPKTASHLRPIIAKAPVPSEGWAEPVVTAEEAEKEVDADFDPYESGDEPEASDDSDFDPSAGGKGKQKKAVVKKKKKPVKGGGGAGAGGKVRKKELDGGEEAWAGGAAVAAAAPAGNDVGWDFEIQMNPDFMEGDADGDDLQLLEGQFDPNTINPKPSVVASAASARPAATPSKTNIAKKKREAVTSYSSTSGSSTSQHQTMVTISDSHQSSKPIPAYRANGTSSSSSFGSAASASPSTPSPTSTTDWNVHLNRLMTESFDIQTRKHVKFEELDTSELQRIQGTVHEKFGVGFKDIFVAMRKKSIADNKKANCNCPDCVFLAVEEASDTW